MALRTKFTVTKLTPREAGGMMVELEPYRTPPPAAEPPTKKLKGQDIKAAKAAADEETPAPKRVARVEPDLLEMQTPGGSFMLMTTNPEASRLFKVGASYYVDFTEA